MAIKYMSFVRVSNYDLGSNNGNSYEYRDVLTTAGNGDTVIVPRDLERGINITAIPTTDSMKIQTTKSLLSAVIAGAASVVWDDWDDGEVAIKTKDFEGGQITAIRQANTDGTGSGTTEMLLQAN